MMMNNNDWGALLQDGGNSRVNYTKFEPGTTTTIRVLSEVPVVRWTHYLPLAKRSITCLGKGCPVCEARENAKSEGIQPPFSTSKKFALLVYNYSTNKVEVLEQGKTFFEDLYALHTEVGDMTEYDVRVKRVGTKTQTSYTLIPTGQAPFTHEVEESDMINLTEHFKAPTKQQAMDLMSGKSASEVFKAQDNGGDEDFEV